MAERNVRAASGFWAPGSQPSASHAAAAHPDLPPGTVRSKSPPQGGLFAFQGLGATTAGCTPVTAPAALPESPRPEIRQ